MHPGQELIERLAAADPLPDAERLTPEEQREADALLARLIATPVESVPRPAIRAPRRRWALAAATAVCVALAAFAAVNVLDSDAPGPDVVELAVAAVSADDAVYHVRQRTRVRMSPFVPGSNRTIYTESWHTAGSRLHQKVFAAGRDRPGRLVGDFAGRRTLGRMGGPVLAWDARTNTISSIRYGSSRGSRGVPDLDPFGDAGAQLRAFEAQGRLRVAGSVELGGRRAYRLVSGAVEGPAPGTKARGQFVVDAQTYLPLAIHYTQTTRNGDRLDLFIRYFAYERLPLHARSRARLDLDPHPGARCALGAGETMGNGTLGFRNPCAR